MPLFGIDLTENDHSVDYTALKRAGVSFAIVRASLGINSPSLDGSNCTSNAESDKSVENDNKSKYDLAEMSEIDDFSHSCRRDLRLEEHINGLRSVGIKVALYHELHAKNVIETIVEADFFLELLENLRKNRFEPIFCACSDVKLHEEAADASRLEARNAQCVAQGDVQNGVQSNAQGNEQSNSQFDPQGAQNVQNSSNTQNPQSTDPRSKYHAAKLCDAFCRRLATCFELCSNERGSSEYNSNEHSTNKHCENERGSSERGSLELCIQTPPDKASALIEYYRKHSDRKYRLRLWSSAPRPELPFEAFLRKKLYISPRISRNSSNDPYKAANTHPENSPAAKPVRSSESRFTIDSSEASVTNAATCTEDFTGIKAASTVAVEGLGEGSEARREGAVGTDVKLGIADDRSEGSGTEMRENICGEDRDGKSGEGSIDVKSGVEFDENTKYNRCVSINDGKSAENFAANERRISCISCRSESDRVGGELESLSEREERDKSWRENSDLSGELCRSEREKFVSDELHGENIAVGGAKNGVSRDKTEERRELSVGKSEHPSPNDICRVSQAAPLEADRADFSDSKASQSTPTEILYNSDKPFRAYLGANDSSKPEYFVRQTARCGAISGCKGVYGLNTADSTNAELAAILLKRRFFDLGDPDWNERLARFVESAARTAPRLISKLGERLGRQLDPKLASRLMKLPPEQQLMHIKRQCGLTRDELCELMKFRGAYELARRSLSIGLRMDLRK